MTQKEKWASEYRNRVAIRNSAFQQEIERDWLAGFEFARQTIDSYVEENFYIQHRRPLPTPISQIGEAEVSDPT